MPTLASPDQTQLPSADPTGAGAERDPREALIQDLYIWGPALTQEVRARFPSATVAELVKAKIIARKKFTGFEVYVLSGVGLRPYGYSIRYNYIPAKNVVLGTLIVRAMARQYRRDGYEVELFDGYSKRGRDNILLARKDSRLTVVIGRASLTMKAVRVIASVLTESLPEIAELHAVVLQGDLDPVLVNGKVANDLPLQLVQLPLTRITKESFDESP